MGFDWIFGGLKGTLNIQIFKRARNYDKILGNFKNTILQPHLPQNTTHTTNCAIFFKLGLSIKFTLTTLSTLSTHL